MRYLHFTPEHEFLTRALLIRPHTSKCQIGGEILACHMCMGEETRRPSWRYRDIDRAWVHSVARAIKQRSTIVDCKWILMKKSALYMNTVIKSMPLWWTLSCFAESRLTRSNLRREGGYVFTVYCSVVGVLSNFGHCREHEEDDLAAILTRQTGSARGAHDRSRCIPVSAT